VGDPGAGSRVYTEQGCHICHQIDGAGGRLGPDLSDVGRRRIPSNLRQSVVEPGAAIVPGYEAVLISAPEGVAVSGILIFQDEFSVLMMDRDQRLRSFSRRRAEVVIGGSPMPSYSEALAPDALDDLVAFLGLLR